MDRSSPSKNKKTKREKLIISAEYYKNVLKKWEAAIFKGEGRKPSKEDLKNSPDSVQKAYKEYNKLKKYLESTSSTSSNGLTGRPKNCGPSPKKIFGGKLSGNTENITSSTERATTSSSSTSFNRSKHNNKQSKLNEKLEANTSSQDSISNVKYNLFQQKIFSVVNIFSSQVTEKPHNNIKVRDEKSGQEVVRKALIPNRFAKKPSEKDQVEESSEKNCDEKHPSRESSGNSSLLIDEADDIPDFPTKSNDFSMKSSSIKLNSVSAVWQNLSPNPKSKKKLKETRQVDSGWLDRCGMDFQDESQKEEDESNILNETPLNFSGINLNNDEDNDNLSNEKRLYTQGFKNFLMSASSESAGVNSSSTQFYSNNDSVKVNNSKDAFGLPCPIESVSADSGFGNSSFILSTDDIMDIVSKEILPLDTKLTTVEENSIFHNEDACSPPEDCLQTIDVGAISELLSSNPFISTSSAVNENNISRKRKADSDLSPSPSPKKDEPKKKFFKSSRLKDSLPKYRVQSYKPPTPVKKKLGKSAPLSADAKLSTATKIGNNKEYSTGPDTLKISSNNNLAVSTDPIASSLNVTSTRSTRNSTKQEKAVTTSSTGYSGGPSTSNTSQAREYFDEVGQNSNYKGKGYKRPKLTDRERLESKMSSGTVNNNYLKIDIAKKVFVRGRKKISGAKTKRNDWKQKKSFASKEDKLSKMICRKCGEAGHFGKFCMKDTIPKEGPESEKIDDSPFPSLQEAACMARGNLNGPATSKTNVYNKNAIKTNDVTKEDSCIQSEISSTDDTTEKILEESNMDSSISYSMNLPLKQIAPYFSSEGASKLYSQEEQEAVIRETVKVFGYEDFRPGQLEAISRVLKGLSTLVVLSTGSGKSLCYQLPAYLYAKKNPGALCICVSPLVSLMEDQIQGIPSFLQAACLHSNMSSSQRDKVLERIRSKKLHILLVSPEAVCGGLFGILRGVSDLPQISFACIDEVHCVSQWSHNFRPCYLQLSKILREKLCVTTILGLTATATEYTAESICDNLQIDPSTIIRGEIIPRNLNLSVSRDTHRDEALLTLLRGERLRECESIIIYCTRREECQRISCLIRTNLQDIPAFNGIHRPNLKQRVSNNCEAYHAGMTAGRRKLVQQQFMSGNIRIVVATVAFGMGIDKSDIRSVIHYNMPKTFESYVQEIGRAGRDGLPAHCHLFLDNVKGRDLSELRRHVYSNSVDRPTLRKLIRKVFQPCKCARIAEMSTCESEMSITTNQSRCPGHEVSFSINSAVEEFDLAQENITTLLCYLELGKKKWIEMLPHTYETCKIQSYGGPAGLKAAAMKCPPLAAAIALKKEKRKFKDTDSYIEFNVIEVASTLNWNSGVVKKELKNLEWTATEFDNKGNSSRFRKSALLVEFCDLAFHLNAPGDLTDEEADVVLNYLHGHNQEQEKSQIYQLNRVYQALLSISHPKADDVCDKFDEEKSGMLKTFIHDYFTQKTLGVPSDWKNDAKLPDGKEDIIRRDIQELLGSVRDAQFTGRAVAKIFQGIPSPCFPAETWSRNRAFWRKHIDIDFHLLCQIAGQEIIRLQ